MPTSVKSIPEHLIYEMVDGRPIYRRGHAETLASEKEELVGSSYLQSLIITNLIILLSQKIPDDYQLLTNELGIQFAKKSWRAADIAIFQKSVLAGIDQKHKYVNQPPEIVIEVDTKAQLSPDTSTLDYVYQKTDELLNFGVRKVIWIFTDSRKVMSAERAAPWLTQEWNQSIEVMPEVAINVEQLLA